MQLVVRTQGLEQVQTALVKAGPILAKTAMYRAVEKGGAVFVERAKALAPVLKGEATPERYPGELRDSITQVIRFNPSRESWRSRIGPEYKDRPEQDPAVYALFLEFGTEKMAAYPFMRPAYDESWEEAARVVAEEVRLGIVRLEKR